MVNAMIRYRSGELYLGVRFVHDKDYEVGAMCCHICMCLKYSFELIEVQYVDIRYGGFLNDACGVRY
ncbi:hypothetical protein GQ457_10G012830 [Hibiscus cannabinus]